MSAGKSSLINALIGRELLPSANEATTTCLTSVEHRRSARHFRGSCYSQEGARIFTRGDTSIEQIRAWNADSRVKHIHLSGKFRTRPLLAPGLVLHDTPGPNNSLDHRHGEMMLEAVRTVPFKLLCYVLNAGQLGTWDDRRLLEQLRELLARQPGHRLVFILNKIDLLDPERGEDVPSCVTRTRHYLEGLGFRHPIVVPTMASIALYARKAMHAEALTRTERAKLRQSLDDLGGDQESHLHAAMPDPIRARALKALEKAKKTRPALPNGVLADEAAGLEQLIIRSGIKTVEFLINQRGNLG